MSLLRRKLNNGMIVIMEKRDLPVVSFCIANKFGASFEDEKIKGIAHFIEHLMFTGTKTRTHEDISREIEKRGGILNAFTSHDITNYFFKMPSAHLLDGIDIIIDMLNNSVMNPEKFEKEKKVILEEIKMYHDSPRLHVMDMIESNLYEKPFGGLVIGNKETVSALNRDFVFDFFKARYKPSNYVSVIVGDADFDKICEKLENAFAPGKFDYNPLSVVKKNSESVEEREDVDQAHLVFAVHAPKIDTKEFYALQVLNAYLAGGMSSKLFLEIREKRGLAYSVSGSITAEKNYSYYSIYVGTTKEALKEVTSLILEGFKNVKNMTSEELKEAKERVVGLKQVSSEESVDVMNELLFAESFGKGADDYYEFERRIDAVTLETVKKLADIKKYSTAAVVPK